MDSLFSVRSPAEFERRFHCELLSPREHFARLTVYVPSVPRNMAEIVRAHAKCGCPVKILAWKNGSFVFCCVNAVYALKAALVLPRAIFYHEKARPTMPKPEELTQLAFLQAKEVACYSERPAAVLKCELDLHGMASGLERQRFVHTADLYVLIDCILAAFQRLEDDLRLQHSATLLRSAAEVFSEPAVEFRLITQDNALLDRILRFEATAYNIDGVQIRELLAQHGFCVCFQEKGAYVLNVIRVEDDDNRVAEIVGCIWRHLAHLTQVTKAEVVHYACRLPWDGFRFNPSEIESWSRNVIKYDLREPICARALEGMSICGRAVEVCVIE